MFKVEKIQQQPSSVEAILEDINDKIKDQIFLYATSLDNELYLLMKNNTEVIIRSFSKDNNTSFKVQMADYEMFEKKKIIGMYVEQSEAFIIYSEPIQIIYINSQHSETIKINLQETIDIKECSCLISYPLAYLYGRFDNPLTNRIIEINLETLTIKIIHEGKGYCPDYRQGFLCHFQQNRLYIFGGTDHSGHPCDKLLWVYDFQKSYWFALQMDYPEILPRYHSCALTDNSALIISEKQKKVWVLELYQSKLNLLDYQFVYQGPTLKIADSLINFDFEKQKIFLWTEKILKQQKNSK